MSRVCQLWTLSRLLWAAVSLTSVIEGWLRQSGSSAALKSLLIVLIFLCLEVLPVVFAIGELQQILESEGETLSERQPILGRPQFSYLQGGTWEESLEQGFSSSGPLSPERIKGDLYLRILEDFGTPLHSSNGKDAGGGGKRGRGLKLAFEKPHDLNVTNAMPLAATGGQQPNLA